MKKTIVYLVSIIILLIIIVIILIDNEVFTTKKVLIKYKNLPAAFDSFKIVQLSDLHSNEYGDGNKKLIDEIEKQSPDIIVMTGDMIDSSTMNYDTILSLTKKLAIKYPIYYVDGNHEERINKSISTYLYLKLKEMGVHVLNNKKITITKNNQSIDIYGLMYNFKYSINKPAALNQSLGIKDKNHFSILLTHNPTYFHTYANWGADLTLSGHIHGGMIRIPFIGGVLSPEGTIFPKYDAGLFSKKDKKMYISRGLGTSIGFRVFTTAELVTIVLHN